MLPRFRRTRLGLVAFSGMLLLAASERSPAADDSRFSRSLRLVSQGDDADEETGLPRADMHRHDPIDVDARPIVSRSKVSFVRPRRALLEPDGSLIVADWGAGRVVRVTPEDKVTVIAEGLNEPAGLARDTAGNLYVSTHAAGMNHAGTVVRISPMGSQTVFVAGLTGPTALAFDAAGMLYVASFHDDEIVRVAPNGMLSIFADDIPAPSALAIDSAGYVYTASSTEGTVYRISPMGTATVLARGLQTPSDLAFDPDGHLIAANFGGTELVHIDPNGKVQTFAVVPKGTIAHTFDAAGNLLLLNWDYQFLMKVTTHLSVPCPHCGKPIPLRLRPRQQEKPEKKSPVI